MNPRTPEGPAPKAGAFDLAWRPPLRVWALSGDLGFKLVGVLAVGVS